MATTENDVLSWRGQNLIDSHDDKIGKIEEIYLDGDSDAPEWALVTTGLFGTKQSFVPIEDATTREDGIHVPFEKAPVKDAPRSIPTASSPQQEEARALPPLRARRAHRHAMQDTSGPNTDEAMTLSEEELRVGTTEREAGRVRLKKYVVEDEVTKTVPVRREEVRLEREPITDANRGDATAGPDDLRGGARGRAARGGGRGRQAGRRQGARAPREGRHDRRGDRLGDGALGAHRRRRLSPLTDDEVRLRTDRISSYRERCLSAQYGGRNSARRFYRPPRSSPRDLGSAGPAERRSVSLSHRTAPSPARSALDDPARLDALRDVGLIDAAPDATLERLVRVAAELLDVPVAVVSLLEADREFFAAAHGDGVAWLEQRVAPLSHSLCKHVVANEAPVVIADGRTSELASSRRAARDLDVRAYAGVPLTLHDGHTLGALCAIDTSPRGWSEHDVDTLRDVAEIAVDVLEARRRRSPAICMTASRACRCARSSRSSSRGRWPARTRGPP